MFADRESEGDDVEVRDALEQAVNVADAERERVPLEHAEDEGDTDRERDPLALEVLDTVIEPDLDIDAQPVADAVPHAELDAVEVMLVFTEKVDSYDTVFKDDIVEV